MNRYVPLLVSDFSKNELFSRYIDGGYFYLSKKCLKVPYFYLSKKCLKV